uniref:Uncharacterized protein n=1 Tax=Setaria italica TaxID=4555 RepID=K3XP81_SETIT
MLAKIPAVKWTPRSCRLETGTGSCRSLDYLKDHSWWISIARTETIQFFILLQAY